ncbi:hypothetical protein LTR62_003616 [Meristemomyces frigidus]|uniref:Uncharacterized protein n=1 Tax=Meristemomyces frigidus TaxID=1508187 RepID=A0AAN7YGU6_9PEZI|nr:hypothetical protein LTR62_003616 [Meristemomyces frigidus]
MAHAQIATVTDYITVPTTPSSTSIPQIKQAQSATAVTPSLQSTYPTSTSTSSAGSTVLDDTSASPTSNVSASSSTGTVDTAAGAAGSGSSFNISTGGLIALVVIVAIVVIFGISSLTLFLTAKRRQETMRSSLARISRRIAAPLTPRAPPSGNANRRTTVNRGEFAMADRARGHKRGVVRIEEGEVEKGYRGGVGRSGGVVKQGWKGRFWGNDWK